MSVSSLTCSCRNLKLVILLSSHRWPLPRNAQEGLNVKGERGREGHLGLALPVKGPDCHCPHSISFLGFSPSFLHTPPHPHSKQLDYGGLERTDWGSVEAMKSWFLPWKSACLYDKLPMYLCFPRPMELACHRCYKQHCSLG